MKRNIEALIGIALGLAAAAGIVALALSVYDILGI